MTTLSGLSTAMARLARWLRSSRWKCSSISMSMIPLVRETPVALTKVRMASGVKPAAEAGKCGHAGIVPALDVILLHELEELALAEQRVGDVEAVELDLLRWEDAEVLDIPAVDGLVISKLQGTHGVGDPLNRIGLAVGVVVHGVDAPLVPG